MTRSRMVAVGLALSVASCGGGSSSHAVLDSYCRHGASMAATLQQVSAGTITRPELVSKLASSQSAIAKDALAERQSDAATADRMQAVSDAAGRVKVSVASGDDLDVSPIVAASSAGPSCR